MSNTRLSAREARTMLGRARDGESIESLCDEYAVSRRTFFAWRQREREWGLDIDTVLLRVQRLRRRVRRLETERRALSVLIGQHLVDNEDKFHAVKEVLRATDINTDAACALVGLSRSTFYRRLKVERRSLRTDKSHRVD